MTDHRRPPSGGPAPGNLYLDRAPYQHDDYRREVTDKQIELMHQRGIWIRPDQT